VLIYGGLHAFPAKITPSVNRWLPVFRRRASGLPMKKCCRARQKSLSPALHGSAF